MAGPALRLPRAAMLPAVSGPFATGASLPARGAAVLPGGSSLDIMRQIRRLRRLQAVLEDLDAAIARAVRWDYGPERRERSGRVANGRSKSPDRLERFDAAALARRFAPMPKPRTPGFGRQRART